MLINHPAGATRQSQKAGRAPPFTVGNSKGSSRAPPTPVPTALLQEWKQSPGQQALKSVLAWLLWGYRLSPQGRSNILSLPLSCPPSLCVCVSVCLVSVFLLLSLLLSLLKKILLPKSLNPLSQSYSTGAI